MPKKTPKKELVVFRLTEDLDNFFSEKKGSYKGGKTQYLIDSISLEGTNAPLRGDTRNRVKENSARLPVEFIRFTDSLAEKRGCSRLTLINSCLNAKLETERRSQS